MNPHIFSNHEREILQMFVDGKTLTWANRRDLACIKFGINKNWEAIVRDLKVADEASQKWIRERKK